MIAIRFADSLSPTDFFYHNSEHESGKFFGKCRDKEYYHEHRFGTIAVLSLIIFGALEFALVIIPAIIGRSKVRSNYQPVYDVPIILSRPVSAGQIAQMRSCYFSETSPRRYIRNVDLDPLNPVNSGHPCQDSPMFPGRQHDLQPKPGKDWKAVNKANRAILRANKAVLEANHAILEANTAIQQAGEDDLEWMDEIAGLNQLRFPPLK